MVTTIVKGGKRVAESPPQQRDVVKKTFELPPDLAYGLKRLAIDESERAGRSVPETEIVQRLIRAELERKSKTK